MKFGLTDKEYQEVRGLLGVHLGSSAIVYCFGSRARGDHQKFSDLDLIVESSEDLSSAVALVKENCVDSSSLPFSVDIVEYKNFAESYKAGYKKDKVLF